jgi:predicted RNA-binding Zn-ribbon protein involved in translation (DUF1610 family)
MALTQQQQQSFTAHISAKLSLLKCPLCGVSRGFATDDIVCPSIEQGGSLLTLMPPPVRAVQLVCTNCGHIMPFACKTVGI